METIIFWTGKGNYEYWPAGEYDETRYPAEVRPAPYYRTSAVYCTTVQEVAKMFRLHRYEVR